MIFGKKEKPTESLDHLWSEAEKRGGVSVYWSLFARTYRLEIQGEISGVRVNADAEAKTIKEAALGAIEVFDKLRAKFK